MAVWKLELPLPKLGTNCPNLVTKRPLVRKDWIPYLNEIVIMVKKIITMMIMMIIIINNDNTSNDIKDDEDTDNRYDMI